MGSLPARAATVGEPGDEERRGGTRFTTDGVPPQGPCWHDLWDNCAEHRMAESRLTDVERNIAQCRVILSVAAFVAVYIDPTRPTLMRWIPLTGGPFTLEDRKSVV